MNIKCILCPNLARRYYGTLAFRLCDDHARLQTHEMTRIPFVTDSGRLQCQRCKTEWVPPSFFIDPEAKKKERFRGQEYMQIPKNCPLCRSSYWMMERTRGKWKASRYAAKT